MLAIVSGLVMVGISTWVYVMSGVEQPPYVSVLQDGDIDVRNYPQLVVAEVTRQGDRNTAVRAGFGPLAAYIFAKNRPGERIRMTAPVTQTLTGNNWLVRFIMPSQYTLETLPKTGDQDVRLATLPPSQKAVIRFSGVATDALVAAKEAELRAWLDRRAITPLSAPTYAYYNDPLTPGPFRRNEVLFDVTLP